MKEREEQQMLKKIIEMIKKHRAQKFLNEQRKKEEYLNEYFSFMYWVNDMGRLEVPYFQKARQTVRDLKRRGLLEDVYKYIVKRGVKVC